MPNSATAKRSLRQSQRRAVINRSRTSRIKTAVKAVEKAISSGNAAEAKAALQKAQPLLQRSSAKGTLHKNTARRKMSRLSQRVSKISK